MGMKVIDLHPGNFEKACCFFSLFIYIHYFFTIVLGGKYRDKNTNYRSHRGVTYITSSHSCSTEDLCANFAISVLYNLEFHMNVDTEDKHTAICSFHCNQYTILLLILLTFALFVKIMIFL
jgi:hypothetical protein